MYTPASQNIKISIKMLLILSVITGVLYPAIVTLVGQTCFSNAANGDLLFKDSKLVGSSLIGQSFSSDKYFWGRPSHTSPMPYNPLGSAASNLGPMNPLLSSTVKDRIAALQQANPNAKRPVSLDLITSSASGLDPDISLHSAYYQLPRVAKSRNLSAIHIETLISKQLHNNVLNLFSMKTVNVLQLNLALDDLELQRMKR